MFSKFAPKINLPSDRKYHVSNFLNNYYKFHFKTFNDVNRGDIISNIIDKNLYLIVDKQSTNTKQYLKGKKLEFLNERYNYLNPCCGKIQQNEHNIMKFPSDDISYHLSYLKMDKNNKEKFLHVSPHLLEVGDIVIDPTNQKYYQITVFHHASDGLCGGMYDASYYDAIELDNNLKQIPNKPQVHLPFDTHFGQRLKHYLVLNE